MRTKDQHEKEKQLITEMKKNEQKIKKEEKEEKNLRKLIYVDTDFYYQKKKHAQLLEGVE